MAQLVVRNLDEAVKARLKHRAANNGRSLEGEVRDILNQSVEDISTKPARAEKGFGTQLAEIFAGNVPDDFRLEEIREFWPQDFKP